jgi:NMD protein affecting ribosome stability and mRNA decay
MYKPKKRIMCPDCGRQKMVFESESKANNFIKWNKDSIDHGDELRVYYCDACCAYHITHQKYHQSMEGNTDKLIESYNKIKQAHSDKDYELIDELYEILNKLDLKDRKKINSLLEQQNYKDKYDKFVRQEAKVRYYIKSNI